MTNRVRRWIVLLSLAGLAAAGTSTYTHLQIVQDPGYTAFCDVNATVSCTEVYQSRYGSVGGVSVALGGVVWFWLVLLLALADARGPSESKANIAGYLVVWSTIGLAVAMYMAYASFFVLGTVCLLCLVVYATVIGVFVLAGSGAATPMTELPAAIMADLGRLVRRPIGAALAVLFVAGTAAGVLAFPRGGPPAATLAPSNETPAATVSPPAPTAAQQSEFDRFWESQSRSESPVEGETAAVVIVKFTDYQCPACAQTYEGYGPIFAKYASSHPGQVRVVTMDFPLDPECNDQSPNGPHPAACEAAVAVRLATTVSEQARERMERWLYGNQPAMTPESVRTALADVAGISAADFDARYASTLDAVRADIAAAVNVPVEATPTFIVNGVVIKGSLQPEYFDQAIAYELARAAEDPS
jgi:uncharacterized membrane protein/predicted DsbA family dithiol-disulfide isomerase